MHEAWRTLLEHAGAHLGDGHVRFDRQDAETPACPDSFVTLLPQFAALRAAGPDAGDFLQAQLTCDIHGLGEGGGTLSAWCNPKGRVITTLLIHRLGGEFLLLVPAPLADTVRKRLGMYILRSDVQLTTISEHMPILGHADSAPETGTAGGAGSRMAAQDHGYRLELPAVTPARRLIIAAPGDAPGLWDRLRQSQPIADSRCWDRLDIEAGIAWLDEGTSEQFLPQELNLDGTPGLSFTKGCFPGQEVIARLRYRGRVKRRLFLLSAEPGVLVTSGEKLQDSHAGSMGMVIGAAEGADGRAGILAVLDSGRGPGEMAYRADGSMLHIDRVSVPADSTTD